MRSISTVVLLSAIVVSARAGSDVAPSIAELVARLGHESYEVRAAAERRLLELGPRIEAALTALKLPDVAEVRARVQRARRIFADARRLSSLREAADDPTGRFWVELRDLLRSTGEARRSWELRHAALPDDVAARLERATAVAKRFVREWKLVAFHGSDRERRNAELVQELRRHGVATLPALLDVLSDIDIDPPDDATRRIQCRALLALRLVGDPVAVPQLVRRTRSSYGARIQAVHAITRITGECFFVSGASEYAVDRERLDAWWARNRARYEGRGD